MSFESESEDGGLQLMDQKSLERSKQRSETIKKQKQLIDELVDFRVKMQSILVLVNRLPQVDCLASSVISRAFYSLNSERKTAGYIQK